MKTHTVSMLRSRSELLRRQAIDLMVRDVRLARVLRVLIPNQCPFARKIRFGSRLLFEIPPLCKLNPFYGFLMELRFEALIRLESLSSGPQCS